VFIENVTRLFKAPLGASHLLKPLLVLSPTTCFYPYVFMIGESRRRCWCCHQQLIFTPMLSQFEKAAIQNIFSKRTA
jgi:hypothetical protein